MDEVKDYWIVYLYKGIYRVQFHRDGIRNIIEYHMKLSHSKIYPFLSEAGAINYLQNKENE